jgi:hypothetical protein
MKAAKASAKAKAAAQKTLVDVTKKEAAIQKDIAAFDAATLETLSAAKAKVDQDLAKLKQDIASARAMLK